MNYRLSRHTLSNWAWSTNAHRRVAFVALGIPAGRVAESLKQGEPSAVLCHCSSSPRAAHTDRDSPPAPATRYTCAPAPRLYRGVIKAWTMFGDLSRSKTASWPRRLRPGSLQLALQRPARRNQPARPAPIPPRIRAPGAGIGGICVRKISHSSWLYPGQKGAPELPSLPLSYHIQRESGSMPGTVRESGWDMPPSPFVISLTATGTHPPDALVPTLCAQDLIAQFRKRYG